jgi:hypothetical protein
MLAVADGGAPGQVVDGRLGRAIVREGRIAAEAADRGRVDDRPTAAELEQPGDLVLQAQRDATQVHGQDLVEVASMQLVDLESDDPELAAAATAARVAFLRPFVQAERTGALRVDAERAALLAWTIAHGAVDLDLNGHLRKGHSRTKPETLVAELVVRLTA